MNAERTVLIVDDVPEDRFVYERFLGDVWDYQLRVEKFVDAESALKRCGTSPVDCIVLDYELPDRSGIEFLDALSERHPEPVAVVMVTGRGSERVAVEALKRGAAEYIVKSEIDSPALCRAVSAAIERNDLKKKLRASEKYRRESEQRLRLFIEGVQDYAIVMLDHDGVIESWNSGAKRMFGFDETEVLGTTVDRLVVEPARVAGTAHEEIDLRRKDGSTFCANVATTTLTQESDEPLGFAKVIRDLTEQRSAERDLKNAVAARDEFLSVASHELNTPVSAMLLEVQALRRVQRKDLPQEKKMALLAAGLERCDQQVSRLSKLTGELLDVSRVTAGRLSYEYSKFPLDRLVRDIVDEFSESLRRAEVEVQCELESDVVVLSDVMRLEQVIRNLVSNVIKYAPKGTLVVRVYGTASGGVASFQDTGPGIPPEFQDRVFLRFERASGAKHVSGLGLGLYIARRLLEGLGGSIRLDSVPGQGSTFTLSIPLAPTS